MVTFEQVLIYLIQNNEVYYDFYPEQKRFRIKTIISFETISAFTSVA